MGLQCIDDYLLSFQKPGGGNRGEVNGTDSAMIKYPAEVPKDGTRAREWLEKKLKGYPHGPITVKIKIVKKTITIRIQTMLTLIDSYGEPVERPFILRIEDGVYFEGKKSSFGPFNICTVGDLDSYKKNS